MSQRVPKPDEQSELLIALQKEHEIQLSSDTTGNFKKYDVPCLLRLMVSSSSESRSSSDVDSPPDNDVELVDAAVSIALAATLMNFMRRMSHSLLVELWY